MTTIKEQDETKGDDTSDVKLFTTFGIEPSLNNIVWKNILEKIKRRNLDDKIPSVVKTKFVIKDYAEDAVTSEQNNDVLEKNLSYKLEKNQLCLNMCGLLYGYFIDTNKNVIFFGEIINEPRTNDDVFAIFFISLDCLYNKSHCNKNKRGVYNANREETHAPILYFETTQNHRIVDKKKTEHNELNCPTLSTKNVLIKEKQKAIDDDFYTSRLNFLVSSNELKYGTKYNCSVYTMRYEKLVLHLWTPNENQLYKTMRFTQFNDTLLVHKEPHKKCLKVRYQTKDSVVHLYYLYKKFPLWFEAVMEDEIRSPNFMKSSATKQEYFGELQTLVNVKTSSNKSVDDMPIRGGSALKCDFDVKNKNQSSNFKMSDEMAHSSKSETDPKQTYLRRKVDSRFKTSEKYNPNDKNENASVPPGLSKVTENKSDELSKNDKTNDTRDIIPCNYYDHQEKPGKSSNENAQMDCSVMSTKRASPEIDIGSIDYCPKNITPLSILLEQLKLKNKKKKSHNKKKPTYLENCSEIKKTIRKKCNSKQKIDTIKNGSFMGSVTITTDSKSKKYQIYNTCPFDTIIQCLSVSYIDSFSYSEYMNASKNQLYKFAIDLVKNGVTSKIYKKRIELLTPVIKINVSSCLCGTIILDARYHVNTLMEYLLMDEPSILEYYTCKNNQCDQIIKPRLFYPLNLQELMKGSLANLQGAIFTILPSPLETYETKCLCNTCSEMLTVTKVLQQHVWFNTTFNIDQINSKCQLHDIPNEVQIQNNRYRLVAVIDFVLNENGDLSHYITHTKRKNGCWETYNDLIDNVTECNYNKIVVPHTLFFIKLD